ncbi:LOW QUALITY PROTEIN: uncharacterized protein LOC126795457 [Argentina anserina]|uniref:LOW QUALITY PROTEIN: uncharacterized protein LOC126795457 n=1 Tax=Argentina anserina TaxID=57926 RepID=UPI0021768C54|nr:LOW QUALITY PROTEIN: uncharacterized protein LOC126795457 [Potentilla anserina]
MAVLRATSNMMLRHFSQPSLSFLPSCPTSLLRSTAGLSIRCAASSEGDGGNKVSARLSQVNKLLQEAEQKRCFPHSSTKSNKLVNQAIIDAASYVPPPPSEEQKKKIAKMAAIGEQKRLKSKKVLSDKKAFRRTRDSWD